MIARGAQPAQPQDQSVWWDSLLYNQSNKLHLRNISTFSMIFTCLNCKKERNIFRKEHSALYYHLPISFQLAEDILRWAGLAFSTKTEKVFRNPHYYHPFFCNFRKSRPPFLLFLTSWNWTNTFWKTYCFLLVTFYDCSSLSVTLCGFKQHT